jgi:competence protein ComEC
MLLFTLSFLLGVAQLLWLPTIKLTWLIFPFFVLCLCGTYCYFSKLLNQIQVSTLVLCLGLSLGFSYGLISSHYAKSHQLQFIPQTSVWLTGKVDNLPIYKSNKVKFTFKVNELSNEVKVNKLLVSWYDNKQFQSENTEYLLRKLPEVKAGQTWKFKLKIKPIHGYQNPGSFDYSQWLFRNAYDATASVKEAVLVAETNSYDIKSKFNLVRAKISKLIKQKFPSKRVQSLIQALTIGDKSLISFDDSTLFQDTGTAHLIAISGLHIGLIAFVGVLFGRLLFWIWVNERVNRFKYEAVFAVMFSLFYALLAGMSIPTIRALVMVVLFSIAHAYKKRITRWQAWSYAMLVVLLIDPFSVLDMGFWFSFGAVATLMFSFTGRKQNPSKWQAFIKAQLVILIGLMPLMVVVFKQINLLTPFANILVLPLASLLIIPLIFASLLVYVISETMAGFLFHLVNKTSEILFWILDYLQQFNFLKISISHQNLYALATLLIISFVLLLPRLFRWRFLSAFLVIPFLLTPKSPLKNKEFKVNLLDVGQGLSVIITTQNNTMIYDTGAKFDSGFSLVDSVILPFLQTSNIENINMLILSHGDNDHAGGAKKLIEYFENIKVLDVVGQHQACLYPESWLWDGVLFEVLSPFELIPYFGNNSSCVVKVSSEYGSILLTGDIEEAVEFRLVSQFKQKIQSDILLVPHHGSRSSSGEDFIDAVKPEYALNSSGYANQFNHPHPLIKQSYKDKAIKFLDTQDKGMVEVVFKRKSIQTSQYLDKHHHFWNTED